MPCQWLSPWGCFSGGVKVEWIDDPAEQKKITDKSMRKEEHRVGKLLANFRFHDHVTGLDWDSPEGSYINGANIPPEASFFVACLGLLTLGLLFSPWVLWNPYIGPYRRASVVHDTGCQDKTRPSWQVHRMFAHAARADGAPWHLALVLWLAVRLFGPGFPGRRRPVV